MAKWVLIAVGLIIGFMVYQAVTRPDFTPPYWDEECVQSYTTFIPTWNGNIMVMVPQIHCTKYEPVCEWGRDYAGEKVCPARSS